MNGLERRSAAKIAGIARQDNIIVLGLANETEGSGTHEMLREICPSPRRNDANGAAAEIPQKRRVGLFEMHNYRAWIEGLDAGHGKEVTAFGRVIGGVTDVLERRFYVGGSERRAVV